MAVPPTSSADLPAGLRRSRVAAALAFGTQGFVFIGLTTRLPVVQRTWDLGELALSGLLLMMVLLAGVGSVVAETASRRTDSAVLLRVGLGLITVAVPVFATTGAFWLFVASLAAYGVALGVVDATTNMQAVALEHRYGRPILPSFHGAWTVGGIAGSAVTLATAGLPFAVTGTLAVVPLVVAFAPFLRRAEQALVAAARVAVPWRPIVLVGVAMVIFYMVDTAASTWGPTYLRNTFPTPAGLVALATFPYLVASGLLRLAGDGLVARFGPVRVLRVGAVIACAALAVVVFAPTWPVAVAGFTLLGGGVAVVAPLSFSAAARIAGQMATGEAEREVLVDAVIGRFNQFNYVGALFGAVLTGVVGAGDLRWGFAVPMVLVLGILPLARAFAPRLSARPPSAAGSAV
ncbi:MAG TPA: MFS transporter [Marmoricola sp.]|nr:MFS transporter [Marmoricola sp.]